MEKRNILYLVAALVGIGIVYFAINQMYSTGEITRAAACTDSDGGLNYNVYGYVTLHTQVFKDKCTGNTLTEYYCRDGKYKESKPYTCPGKCLNGQCV